MMYETASGVPQDYRQAMAWLRKAADQGNVTAEDEVADLYAKGLGVRVDLAQARAWYQKAADAGDQDAQTWLAQNPS